ncbi:hypothetical protein AOLI_G00299490 [Acnodon oligacanthus]
MSQLMDDILSKGKLRVFDFHYCFISPDWKERAGISNGLKMCSVKPSNSASNLIYYVDLMRGEGEKTPRAQTQSFLRWRCWAGVINQKALSALVAVPVCKRPPRLITQPSRPRPRRSGDPAAAPQAQITLLDTITGQQTERVLTPASSSGGSACAGRSVPPSKGKMTSLWGVPAARQEP